MALADVAGRRRKRTASRWVPYVFLAPASILFVVLFVLPIGYAVWQSLHAVKVSGLGLGRGARSEVFAGLANYSAVFADTEFWSAIGRVLVYGAILIPCMLGLALLFALILDSPRARLRRFGRLAIFLPYAVPSVIASLLWGFLYLPAVSPLHYVLRRLELPQPDLLGSGIMGAVVNIGVWGGVGFNMLVIYTALRAAPRDLYEAARIDGCSEIQIALRIKIPLVTPALIMTALFSTIATLQVFSEPTTLRPLTNSLPSGWTPLMKIYQDAFVRNDLYTAAAASIVIACATLVLSFTFLRLVQARAFAQENQ
jgi:multiple sugar transport system permease protein